MSTPLRQIAPRRRRFERNRGFLQLLVESAVGGDQFHASGGAEQNAVFLGHQVGAAEEHPARSIDPCLFRPAFDELREFVLQILKVAGAVLVEGDEVECQPLDPEVLMRLEEFAEQRLVTGLRDPDEENRQVAGDPVLPEVGLGPRVLQDRGACPQPRVAVEQAPGHALEAQRILRGQPEMAELDLTVSAGERERPRNRATVVVLVDETARRLLAVGACGGEREPGGAAGRDAQRLAQRDDRIEHGSAGSRQLVAPGHRGRPFEGPSTADETRSIGFEFGRHVGIDATAEHVNEIGAVGSFARPPRADRARRAPAPPSSRRRDC